MRNKLFIAVMLTAVGLSGIASEAKAGEGGIAAAAAFHLDSSGKVTDIAVSTGIGKTSAFAEAELNYSSVLTSMSTSNQFDSSGSSKTSYTGNTGCYYYYYGCGPSDTSSENKSTQTSASTSTYQPVTSVKAFSIGSAGSLSYSPSGGYYYYYGSAPSIFIGGEDPASVGTAQANSLNLNAIPASLGYTP